MAKITIKGRIGNLEVKQGTSGDYIRFSLAESQRPEHKGGEFGTCWYSCIAGKNQVKQIESWGKGALIMIDGKLEPKTKDDKTYLNVNVFSAERLWTAKKDDTPTFTTDDINF